MLLSKEGKQPGPKGCLCSELSEGSQLPCRDQSGCFKASPLLLCKGISCETLLLAVETKKRRLPAPPSRSQLLQSLSCTNQSVSNPIISHVLWYSHEVLPCEAILLEIKGVFPIHVSQQKYHKGQKLSNRLTVLIPLCRTFQPHAWSVGNMLTYKTLRGDL